MKKVTFKKKIRAVWINEDLTETGAPKFGMSSTIKDGTDIELDIEAMFIDWGLDTDERMGSWTVAIVQLEDGSIDYIHPINSKMKFVEDHSALSRYETVNANSSPTMNDFITALNSASNVHSITFFNTVAEYQATIKYHEDGLLPDDFNIVEDNGEHLIDFLING